MSLVNLSEARSNYYTFSELFYDFDSYIGDYSIYFFESYITSKVSDSLDLSLTVKLFILFSYSFFSSFVGCYYYVTDSFNVRVGSGFTF